jgi:peptidoglycan/LPS O-acetylase OafA/YrhL
LLFFLPLIVGLFIASRKGIVHAESIMLLLVVMLLSAPFLSGFSDHQNVPYRFVPVVTFFAIGTGLLLVKPKSLGETSSVH